VIRKGRLLAAAGLALAMFGVGAIGVLREYRPEPPLPTAPESASAVYGHPVIAQDSLAALISALQQRLRSQPADWRSYARLGMAYVQHARVTADPSFYPKSEEALERSLALHGRENFEAFLGMASLAAARHDFAAALDWAERATRANPHSADAHAVLGDAQVELGRYHDAFATYQIMVDLRPDLSTYARTSYAWELQGSYSNAVRAMELALQAAGAPVDAAWASVQLGNLDFNAGRLDRAAERYRWAVAADESFIPAHAGLARVAAARGRIDQAIGDLGWVVERYPLPEYVIALGDLYAIRGRGELALQQYALVEAQQQLLQANGVNVDLEIALFQADHQIHVSEALASARKEWARRRSIHVADVLAWTLYATGRYEEAIGYADHALRLGTENPLFFFHRGMIQRALGRNGAARRDLARALDINPHFSILWSPEAAQALEALGGAS
jgi:tetratricopeptide (TPR) repeat protein